MPLRTAAISRLDTGIRKTIALLRFEATHEWLPRNRIPAGLQPWRTSVHQAIAYPRDGQGNSPLRSGHIGLQDHGSPCWYKNIKLLPLNIKKDSSTAASTRAADAKR
jgi:hypothetical protein